MSKSSSKPFIVQIRPDTRTADTPSWVPAEGQFANISLNTLLEARPAGWPTSDVGGPFANWSGGTLATSFSKLGAYVVHGSGHLSAGAALWAGVWCFDLDTLKWVGRNIPAEPMLEGSPNFMFNSYGEITSPASIAGHTYPPHTYDGLVFQPSSQGGGAKGSLLRFCFAGSNFHRAVHRFDLSSTTAAPTRIIDDLPFGSASASYPATATDEGRGGVWVLTCSGNGPLMFVSFYDWSITKFPVEYNEYGDHSLIYLPAPYNCLFGMGRSGNGGVSISYWVCPIVGNVPQGFTRVTATGTEPSDHRSGGVWSTLLKCIVSYEGAGSRTVHKLTPPDPSALTTGTWTWTSETLTGVNDATPSKNGVANNGVWSRFMEVPAARCFIFCDGVGQPVQAWRLTGT